MTDEQIKYKCVRGKQTSPPNSYLENRSSLIEEAIPLNRYDSDALMKAWKEAEFSIAEGTIQFKLILQKDYKEEIEFYANLPQENQSNFKAIIEPIIKLIPKFDNLFQETCRHCAGEANDRSMPVMDSSGAEFHQVIRAYEDFAASLAYLTIEKSESLLVKMRYWGTFVNDEWEPKFKLVDGEWYGLVGSQIGWQRIDLQ